jgi:hypothetical protein
MSMRVAAGDGLRFALERSNTLRLRNQPPQEHYCPHRANAIDLDGCIAEAVRNPLFH